MVNWYELSRGIIVTNLLYFVHTYQVAKEVDISPKDFMYHEYSQFQLCVDREEDKQQHVLLLFIKSNLITHNVVSLWILMLK